VRGLALVVACAACGRIGFDPPTVLAADAQGPRDASGIDSSGGASKIYTISSNGAQPAQLFELVPATGQLTPVGTIVTSFGTLTGLAFWDANTLYASSASSFVRITLSPFSAASEVAPSGDFATLERLGTLLFSIEEGDNHVAEFMPQSTGISFVGTTLPAIGQGGDLAHTSDGTWYWFTNSTKQLYVVDLIAGTATAVGSPAAGAPFMTGLVADDADQLYAVGQNIFPISKTTGQLGTTITPCITCPTPFALQSGDTTRSP
jgi:hypothetical protein